jgi:hypothetical protein
MPSFNTYAQQNPSNLDILDIQKINYGTISKQAVVEQNQTYMAYFDGVGGTGPELIDQTAYFIKYIIDTQGNVTNPEPDIIPSRPQAVALYNLIDNFEPGKNAVVKLIGNDPLLTANPNDDALTGIYPITHVGRIVPILVTETGPNIQDYITTMSFGSLTTQTSNTSNITITNTVANVTAQFQYTGGEYTISGDLGSTIYDGVLLSSPAWQTVNDSTKRILSSSLQTGTRIRFKLAMYLEETWNANNGFNYAFIRIYQNGVTLGSERALVKDGMSQINDGGGGVYETDWTSYFDYMANDSFEVKVRVFDGSNSREVKVKGTTDNRNQTVWYIQQETPAGITTGSTEVALIPNVNIVTSSYFEGVGGGYNLYNGGFTTLTMNPSFYPIYETGLTQNLDSASATFGFSEIKIPFNDIKPGDFIRFNYDKTRVHTIYRISELNFGSTSTLALYVTPAISNLDSVDIDNRTLNHFIIYRVINDGTYIVLDVPKPVVGNSFTGIIQPEFISKELTDNYDKIITDLTSKEIIS